jgi:hypothetical protein
VPADSGGRNGNNTNHSALPRRPCWKANAETHKNMQSASILRKNRCYLHIRAVLFYLWRCGLDWRMRPAPYQNVDPASWMPGLWQVSASGRAPPQGDFWRWRNCVVLRTPEDRGMIGSRIQQGKPCYWKRFRYEILYRLCRRHSWRKRSSCGISKLPPKSGQCNVCGKRLILRCTRA